MTSTRCGSSNNGTLTMTPQHLGPQPKKVGQLCPTAPRWKDDENSEWLALSYLSSIRRCSWLHARLVNVPATIPREEGRSLHSKDQPSISLPAPCLLQAARWWLQPEHNEQPTSHSALLLPFSLFFFYFILSTEQRKAFSSYCA